MRRTFAIKRYKKAMIRKWRNQKESPTPKTEVRKNVGKTFSKSYRRHYELISKFNVGLKALWRNGLLEPGLYGDLVYKFKALLGRIFFSFQFRKIIIRYKRIGLQTNRV